MLTLLPLAKSGRPRPSHPAANRDHLVVWHEISVTYSTGGSGSEGAIGVIVAGDPLE